MSAPGINREGFAALLPVRDGEEPGVREALGTLGSGDKSPFARSAGTHFARLTLVPPLRDRHERELSTVPFSLFFAAEFDISPGDWLQALGASLPDDLDRILDRCAGYPGAGRTGAFENWMLEHGVPAGFSLHGYPELRSEQVAQILELRERISAFAVETRGLEPAALARRWAEEDWEGER